MRLVAATKLVAKFPPQLARPANERQVGGGFRNVCWLAVCVGCWDDVKVGGRCSAEAEQAQCKGGQKKYVAVSCSDHRRLVRLNCVGIKVFHSHFTVWLIGTFQNSCI